MGSWTSGNNFYIKIETMNPQKFLRHPKIGSWTPEKNCAPCLQIFGRGLARAKKGPEVPQKIHIILFVLHFCQVRQHKRPIKVSFEINSNQINFLIYNTISEFLSSLRQTFKKLLLKILGILRQT